MASIRRLKKDIDCLTFAVVDDSLNCLAVGKSMDGYQRNSTAYYRFQK